MNAADSSHPTSALVERGNDDGHGDHEGDLGWGRIKVAGGETYCGDIVGFDTHLVVIAFDQQVDIDVGRAATIAIGFSNRTARGVTGQTVMSLMGPDGRACIALAIDENGASRLRRVVRFPFAERIDVMIISSRSKDASASRVQSFNLSTRGLGAISPRAIAAGSSALLRFAVPPNRGSLVQVRGVVAYCREITSDAYQVGFKFERVGAGPSHLLHAAVSALSREAEKPR